MKSNLFLLPQLVHHPKHQGQPSITCYAERSDCLVRSFKVREGEAREPWSTILSSQRKNRSRHHSI